VGMVVGISSFKFTSRLDNRSPQGDTFQGE
jgi:hypothetical protein